MKEASLRPPSVATILSVNAGYVDTAGFLALHGLFASHVTGNFVTLGASIAQGTTGGLAKLLALPVFCISIFGIRLLHYRLENRGRPIFATMLSLMLVLLIGAGIGAIVLGPFADGDTFPAIATGMMLVVAMAIQNAAHRIHLTSAPPSTVMTGTTTQIMLDLADIFHGTPTGPRPVVETRLRAMLVSVVAFATGCAGAAMLYMFAREGTFLIPPLVTLAALVRYMGDRRVTSAS